MQDTLSRTRLHTGAAYEFITAPGYTGQGGPLPTVILLAGWKSDSFSASYTALAARLRAIGYHTMQLSLRGHTDSAGDINTVTRKEHVQDLWAALQYLGERPEVSKSIAVVASSYGAYIAACTAPEAHSVDLMVLRAPALYPQDGWNLPTAQLVARPDRLEWRQQFHKPDESEALRTLGRFRGKLLIVWSGKDEDLPQAVLRSYDAVARHLVTYQLSTLVDAGHSLNEAQREEFNSYTEQFLKKNRRVKNSAPTV